MEGKNYINGQWRWAITERTFERRNPANVDEVTGVAPRSNQRDTDEAVLAARQAFGQWRRMSRIRRGEYLDQFVALVRADAEDLARLLVRESGKQINEARADVIEGIHTAQYWSGRSRMASGEVYASEVAEKESYMLRKPKGVVAAITPWNFPFAIPLWLICPSIVEGNTVVFKPAEETPLTGQRIVEYFHRIGLPPGVLNLVHGPGGEAGRPLVIHPDVDVVLFTGSYEVGSRIKQQCATDYRKMVACEMGGKNAIIVFDDADLDLAVNAAVLSAFKTTGQRCVSASRIIIQQGLLKQFEEQFVEVAKRLRIGDPLDEGVFMGPLVSEAAAQKVQSYNDLAKQEGAKVLLDGGRLKSDGYGKGYFFSPFIYEMAPTSPSRAIREEVFGPHVAILPFKTMEEAVRIYNDTEYGFALSVISEDYRKIKQIREECDFGVGYVNLPTIGAEVHLPFGGLKKSGTGLPSASYLSDVVTHRVAWTMNHAREIKMAQGLSAKVG
jgi:aldehyde dehydrogenase (NAD+)